MKIAVGVSGFECGKEIRRALDPWYEKVDYFILGDGKYDLYDGVLEYSNDKWLERYIEDRDLPYCLTQIIPYWYSGRQIKKRQKMFDIAGRLECDYLIVIDADDYIHPEYQDFDTFFEQLEKEINTTDRIYWMKAWIPSAKEYPKQHNAVRSKRWRKYMRVHKDPGTMRYCCESHFTWCPKDVTDEQIFRYSMAHRETSENPFIFNVTKVIDGIRITTDRNHRTPEQLKKGKEWAWQNIHDERARQHYLEMKLSGMKPPAGFNSWDEFAEAPHRYDKKTGKRIVHNAI